MTILSGDLNPMEGHYSPRVYSYLETTFRAFPSDSEEISEDDSEENVEDHKDSAFDPFVEQQNHIRFAVAARNPNAPTGIACEEDYLRTTNTPRKRELSLYHPDRAAAPRKKKLRSYLLSHGEYYAANLRGESARYQLAMRALKEDDRICAWQRHEMEEELWVTHLRQIRTLKRMYGIVDEQMVRERRARKKAEAKVAAIDWAEENENTLRSFADDESDKWDSSRFREYRCINPAANPARPREKIPPILCTSADEDEFELDRSQQEILFYEDLEGEPEAIEKQEEVHRYEAELEAFHCTSLLPLRRRSDAEKDMWETHIQTLVDIKTRRKTRMETEDEEKKLAQVNNGVISQDDSVSLAADAGQAQSELPEALASQPDPAPKLLRGSTAFVAKQDADKSSVVVTEPTPPMSEDEDDSSHDHLIPKIEHAQSSPDHSTRAALRDALDKNGGHA